MICTAAEAPYDTDHTVEAVPLPSLNASDLVVAGGDDGALLTLALSTYYRKLLE